LVDAAVNAIQKAGNEPATTAEVRAELAAYQKVGWTRGLNGSRPRAQFLPLGRPLALY